MKKDGYRDPPLDLVMFNLMLTVSLNLPQLFIYRIEDIPDELGFRHRFCETANYLSIFEHDINRLSYNPIFLDCLSIFIIVQLCDNECILIL